MDKNKKPCVECNGRGYKRKGYAILQGGRLMHITCWGKCKYCGATGETYKTIHELNQLGSCAI